MKKLLTLVGMLAFLSQSSPALALRAMPTESELIKGDGPAVYYLYGGKRYVFPTEGTYFSWYADFSTVQTLPQSIVNSYSLGGNVTLKPGVKLVKVTTDPKVYAVDRNGMLRWIANEYIAKAVYGSDWAKYVVDVPDSYFTNYQVGAPISLASDYHPSDLELSILSIAEDKGLESGVIKRFTEADNGKLLYSVVGNRFALILASHGDGGYQSMPPVYPSDFLVLERSFHVSSLTGATGDFGKDVWIFRTVFAGTGDMSVSIRRPWEPATSQQTIFSAKVQGVYNALQ